MGGPFQTSRRARGTTPRSLLARVDRRTAEAGKLAAAALVALAVGWGLRGACAVEHAPEDASATDTVAAPDAAPPTARSDTARVTPDEAAVARPREVPAPQLAPSGLAIPVAGVRPEDLVDTFADARSEGRIHDAIDIIAPRGTPVLAAADGEVVRLFTSERGGLTLYQVDDDGRTVFYYAHLDGYADGLAAGQRVTRGEAVGYVGDTGNATPGNHHLHFAVWTIEPGASFWEGEPVNPYPLLSGR